MLAAFSMSAAARWCSISRRETHIRENTRTTVWTSGWQNSHCLSSHIELLLGWNSRSVGGNSASVKGTLACHTPFFFPLLPLTSPSISVLPSRHFFQAASHMVGTDTAGTICRCPPTNPPNSPTPDSSSDKPCERATRTCSVVTGGIFRTTSWDALP